MYMMPSKGPHGPEIIIIRKILVRVYEDRQSRKYEAPDTYSPEYNIAGKILPLRKILVREYKAGQSGKL